MQPYRLAVLRQRIGRSVRLMERETTRPLTLSELAGAACLSRFHYLRVYALLTGETPIATHRRLRLKAAARHLGRDRASVTDAALWTGFESPEGFTRAFGRLYGRSPSSYRGAGSLPPAPPRARIETHPTQTVLVSGDSALDTEQDYLRLMAANAGFMQDAGTGEVLTFGRSPGLSSLTDWGQHAFGLSGPADLVARSPSPRRVLPGGVQLAFSFRGALDSRLSVDDLLTDQTSLDGFVAVGDLWTKRL